MSMVSIETIKEDILDFDYSILNKNGQIDKQKENPASYAKKITPINNINMSEFLEQTNKLFSYVSKESKSE